MSELVGVVGGGIMGAGIAEVAARAGCEVIVREIDDAACTASRQRISKSVDRAAASGKLDGDQASDIMSRLSFTTDLGALADRDLVIEAVVEDEHTKTSIFRRSAASCTTTPSSPATPPRSPS